MHYHKVLSYITMLVIFIMSTVSASSQSTSNTPQDTTIEVSGVFQLLEAGAIFIDVREDDELVEVSYQIEGLLHIPLGEIETQLSNIPRDKTVIVACRSGARSAKAYRILKKNGYTNVCNMNGGIIAWEEAGLPVIRQ